MASSEVAVEVEEGEVTIQEETGEGGGEEGEATTPQAIREGDSSA